MTLVVTPAAITLWSTAVLAFAVVWVSLRHEEFPGSRTFPFLMLSVVAWSLLSGFEAAAVELSAKLVLSKIEYVGLAATPLFFLVFAAEYSRRGRWLGGFRRIALWIPATATVILAATNESTRWLWAEYLPGPTGTNSFVYAHGPAYYFVAAYVYLFVLIGCILVARSALRRSGPERRQAMTILLASVVPLIAGLLYVIDVSVAPGLDLIPVSFAITGLVFFTGIGIFRVFDVVPAARSALVEQTSDAVIVADAKGQIVDANPTASLWLPATDSLIGCPITEAVASWRLLRTACLKAEAAHMELILQDDPLRYVDAQVTPLRDRRGRSRGCFVALRDITTRYRDELELQRVNEQLAEQVRQIEALHDELREQAIRDGLTGLFNRRYLDEILPRELSRASREKDMLSIVMIDIDHFKLANDRYGHGEGDRLLAVLGTVLREGTRPGDIACRYGGEEFLLVLPNTPPEIARSRMDDLRSQYIERLRVKNFRSPPTLSAGVAAFPTHAQSDEELLQAADSALYRAKDEGRDRVCVAGHRSV